LKLLDDERFGAQGNEHVFHSTRLKRSVDSGWPRTPAGRVQWIYKPSLSATLSEVLAPRICTVQGSFGC
jgi:hypothetical protein